MHPSLRSFVFTVAVLLATTACVDNALVGPAPPTPLSARAPKGPPQSWTYDPPESWPISIDYLRAEIILPGTNLYPANGFVKAEMKYKSHHARLSGELAITDLSSSSVSTMSLVQAERHTFFAFDNFFPNLWEFTVAKPCGGDFRANILGEVWFLGFSASEQIQMTRESRPATGSAYQNECQPCPTSGGGDADVDSQAYGPYAPEPESEPGCPGESESEYEVGKQYGVGDYTGGQTVSWTTGQGTGEPSACGDAAQVAWVCFDVWNEETGEWEEWGCGWVTTCG